MRASKLRLTPFQRENSPLAAPAISLLPSGAHCGEGGKTHTHWLKYWLTQDCIMEWTAHQCKKIGKTTSYLPPELDSRQKQEMANVKERKIPWVSKLTLGYKIATMGPPDMVTAEEHLWKYYSYFCAEDGTSLFVVDSLDKLGGYGGHRILHTAYWSYHLQPAHTHTHTLKRLHILVEGPDLGDIGHVRLDNGSVSLPSLPDPVLCDFPIREHHSI